MLTSPSARLPNRLVSSVVTLLLPVLAIVASCGGKVDVSSAVSTTGGGGSHAGGATQTEAGVVDGGACGKLDINALQLDFVLDASKAGDPSYLNTHADAFVHQVFFVGSFGDGGIIPAAADYTFVYGKHLSAAGTLGPRIEILQESVTGSSFTTPFISLMIPDDIQPGAHELGAQPGAHSVLLVSELDQATNQPCHHAIAQGTILVTTAQDTQKADGGKIALHASGLSLYPLGSTPWGNLSGVLGPSCSAK